MINSTFREHQERRENQESQDTEDQLDQQVSHQELRETADIPEELVHKDPRDIQDMEHQVCI